jgi:hypothetical protein
MSRELEALWSLLLGRPDALAALHPDETGDDVAFFASDFDVTGLARDAVALATLAAAELLARRLGSDARLPRVDVSRAEAAAAFRSEALFEPVGWERPAAWDPIAGDYRARDRWLRLHTNYASHRRAALEVLAVPADRARVIAAVAAWDADALEAAVVAAGGCAAAMYTREEWRAHPHGALATREPPVALLPRGGPAPPLPPLASDAYAPFAGVRVLDLTRVIAGPVCTRVLAAHGADVLRIDPPGFAEVPALLPETTVGKRCAFLALDTARGEARFAELVAEADVLVHGLRPTALAGLGFDDARLSRLNPALVVATLDAYGFEGPWRARRGFDSLVQMSAGIAAHGGVDRPRPLPAQALDHATGYLLAAGVGRALTTREAGGGVACVRASLVGAANHLEARGRGRRDGAAHVPPPWPADALETASTAWGDLRRVPCPGRIDGRRPTWTRDAAPLGSSPPSFA